MNDVEERIAFDVECDETGFDICLGLAVIKGDGLYPCFLDEWVWILGSRSK